MNLRQIEALAKALAPVIKGFVLRLVDPLESRLKTLETREPVKGEPGKDADPEQLRTAVAEALQSAVPEMLASIPAPKDGKSITLEEVLPPLQVELQQLVAALPAPKAGENGKSVSLEEVLPPLQAELQQLVASLPAPKPGEDGKSITLEEVLPPLQAELQQLVAALPAPKAGEDGKSVSLDDVRDLLTTLHDTAFAKWALEFERRAADVLQRAVDRLPKPSDGKDGFGFEDLTVEHDGCGNVTLRFVRGEESKEFPLRLPVFIDRGVYREDTKDYVIGNGVTFGGNFYIAQKDAPEGKPGISADWRLAVKKGRDGRGGA